MYYIYYLYIIDKLYIYYIYLHNSKKEFGFFSVVLCVVYVSENQTKPNLTIFELQLKETLNTIDSIDYYTTFFATSIYLYMYI